jgi:hypothetical protein
MQNNILLEVFNPSLEGYCTNSAFAGDVHASVNFTQGQLGQAGRSLSSRKLNPLGGGRPWSKVEKDIVTTFNDFSREYIRQIDLHFKTYNKFLAKGSVDLTVQQNAASKQAGQAQQQERRRQHQEFAAREELHFWQDFPRNKKFYHAYLRKLFTLFNQCRMPDALQQESAEEAARDPRDLRKPREAEPASSQ